MTADDPRLTAVIDADTFERPIYAGNAIQTVKSGDAKKVFTVRTAAFAAAGNGGSASVEAVANKTSALSSWVEDRVAASDRPELTSAKVVVSGGRGVGSKESFDLIEGLADKLGAAVGASRAAVDSGAAATQDEPSSFQGTAATENNSRSSVGDGWASWETIDMLLAMEEVSRRQSSQS